jgi:acetolactate synthase-1/2/3 large subunit
MKQTISGGEAMTLAAKANGIKRVFGIPGAQIYPLFDAFGKHGFEVIAPRHEQAAAYMAMGAAKSTGQPEAFSVVPGPGVLNATAALCTAMGTCAKVLCLTGQVPSSYLGSGRGHLHELTDQSGTLKKIIKDAVRIDDPRRTSVIMNQAFQTLESGRPGPVSVEMCWDTMAIQHEVEITEGNKTVLRPQVDPGQLKAAAKEIAKAKNPMIMVGGGAQHASEAVHALAELLSAPVMSFRSGRGIVADDHPLGVPPVAARLLWEKCDLIIGIGSRLEMPYMRWVPGNSYQDRPHDKRTVIRIDADPAEMNRFIPHIALIADAVDGVTALVEELQDKIKPNQQRIGEIAEAKAKAEKLIAKVQPQIDYLQAIRAVLPRDGIYVPELSQMGFASWIGGLPVYEPRTYISEGFQGTLGFGFPTALGAKVANPDKAVVSVNGDGGFMFGMQELATAAHYKIGLITLVFNNNAYGNVLRDQDNLFEGRHIASELYNPDFVKMAESFGVKGLRVKSPAELKKALAGCIDDNLPALIEVVSARGSESSPWEFIHMYDKPAG